MAIKNLKPYIWLAIAMKSIYENLKERGITSDHESTYIVCMCCLILYLVNLVIINIILRHIAYYAHNVLFMDCNQKYTYLNIQDRDCSD